MQLHLRSVSESETVRKRSKQMFIVMCILDEIRINQMRGIPRPHSVLLHFLPGLKADFIDLRIGHTFMGITEEGQRSIWIHFLCGNIRNGYLRSRDGNGRLFSKESSHNDAESLSVEESEEVISSQLGEVKEDGGHLGKRKGFKSSGRKLEILNEIHDILKTGSQVDKLLYQMGSSISTEIAVMVMKSEKDVKLIFRFFLWAMHKQSLIRFQGLQNLMIEILKESREFEVAWDLLREVRGEGKMTNAASFNVLISAYGKVGMAEKAIESFVVMEEEFSCRPDIFTWNIMLDILVNDQMIEIAWAVYRRMLITDCSPDTTTLNILIRGLCKEGKTHEALEFYDEMTARGIVANMMTYAIVIKSLCQAGKINMATQLLASMKANNCSPGIVIYNIIIDGLCKTGQVDQAFELLNIIKEMNISPCVYTYTSLIHGLFRAGRFDEACKYYKDFIDAQTPNRVLYTVMIDAFCEVGRIDDAFHLFKEMIRTRCLPDTFCYNTLIKGLCKVGRLDEASSVKLEMIQKGYFLDVVTYNTLIYGLCGKGLVDQAHDMFDEMTKTGYFPDVVTYNTLIDGLFKVGEVTKACILFYQMELGNSPSFFLSIAQGSKYFGDKADLQALADGRCSTGRILEAYKLHKRLMESGAVPDVFTYNTMINGLCKAGKIDGALKFFKAMHVRGYVPDLITYNTLINGLCLVNRENDAFTVFQQMAEKGCSPNSVTIKTLMTSLCQEGQEGKFLQAFNLWISYISKRYGINNQDSDRIQILSNQGNLKEAFRTVLRIDASQSNADSGAYCILIIGLCKGGRLDDALTLFAIIQENELDITAPTYVFLITGLCNEGKATRALEVFTNSLKRGIFLNLNPDVCDRLFGGTYTYK